MKTYRVFLGLGSNLGERYASLARAVKRIQSLPEVKAIAVSGVYEADPWGKPEQPKFLNAALEAETSLPPGVLLERLKGIEVDLGRSPGEKWGPREIDIDILLYEGVVLNDGGVQVPHPHLGDRRFALVPLREIAPDAVHPVSGMRVEELARECRDQGRVVMTSHHLIL